MLRQEMPLNLDIAERSMSQSWEYRAGQERREKGETKARRLDLTFDQKRELFRRFPETEIEKKM